MYKTQNQLVSIIIGCNHCKTEKIWGKERWNLSIHESRNQIRVRGAQHNYMRVVILRGETWWPLVAVEMEVQHHHSRFLKWSTKQVNCVGGIPHLRLIFQEQYTYNRICTITCIMTWLPNRAPYILWGCRTQGWISSFRRDDEVHLPSAHNRTEDWKSLEEFVISLEHSMNQQLMAAFQAIAEMNSFNTMLQKCPLLRYKQRQEKKIFANSWNQL